MSAANEEAEGVEVVELNLDGALRAPRLCAQLWPPNHRHLRHFVAMEQAVQGLIGVTRVLSVDEECRRDAQETDGAVVYAGLSDYYRANLGAAQEVLLGEVVGHMELLRELANKGEL